jgi:hypothetical protein
MSVIRRAGAAAAVAGLAVLAGGCGSNTTRIGTGAATTAPPAVASATKAVSFGAATFDVPSSWPVYDLTATPHRCARFDVHAVYLGHQAADAACPARALGKTESVQVEADDPAARSQVLPSAASAQVNGQAVAYEPGGAASHEIVATFPGLGIVVRVSYGTDQATAQQIVASVRKSGA